MWLHARRFLRPLLFEGSSSHHPDAISAAAMRTCASFVMPRCKRGIQHSRGVNGESDPKSKVVIPGLVPGIRVLPILLRREDVDGRDEPGHDLHF